MTALVLYGIQVRHEPDRSETCQALRCLAPPAAVVVRLTAEALVSDAVCVTHGLLCRDIGGCLVFPKHQFPGLEVIAQRAREWQAQRVRQRQGYSMWGNMTGTVITGQSGVFIQFG